MAVEFKLCGNRTIKLLRRFKFVEVSQRSRIVIIYLKPSKTKVLILRFRTQILTILDVQIRDKAIESDAKPYSILYENCNFFC